MGQFKQKVHPKLLQLLIASQRSGLLADAHCHFRRGDGSCVATDVFAIPVGLVHRKREAGPVLIQQRAHATASVAKSVRSFIPL